MKRLAILALVACSSPAPSPGLAGPTVASLACSAYDTNPYGVCYPRQDSAGDVIPNVSFQGTEGSFRLAQVYDPEERLPARLLHIAVLATWCGPCNQEADFISGSNSTGANPSGVSWAKELSPDVLFIDVLSDGATLGTGATIADLQAWIEAHGNVVPAFLDPGTQNLGVFMDPSAVPLNIDIDTRTMKILDTAVGLDTNLVQTLEQVLSTLH